VLRVDVAEQDDRTLRKSVRESTVQQLVPQFAPMCGGEASLAGFQHVYSDAGVAGLLVCLVCRSSVTYKIVAKRCVARNCLKKQTGTGNGPRGIEWSRDR